MKISVRKWFVSAILLSSFPKGTPETNDARRGDGHYAAVMKAMDLLKKYGIIFGTSICYTRANIEAVTSDEFLRMISEKGARFGFYFHYMPVGNNAVLDLMPTMEQREYMIKRIREIRSPQCDIGFFPMDFQNDGEYVGGCIAGGRHYFHINLQVMQNLVYSSTSPIQTFMRTPFLRFSRAHPFLAAYPNDAIQPAICVHARCLKIRNSFRRWFMKQVLTRQIWNLLKPLNISAVNARITLKNEGSHVLIRSEIKKATKHHSTQITKNDHFRGTAEAVPFAMSAIHLLFQTSQICMLIFEINDFYY